MSNKSLVPTGFSVKMVTFETGETIPASSTGSFAAFFDAPQASDYLLTFDVTSPNSNGHHWVTFRHTSQAEKILVEMISGEVHFQVWMNGSVVAHSGNVPFPLAAGTEVHCYVKMTGFIFEFGTYSDASGTREFTPALTWADPTSSIAAGPTVGIYSGGGESGARWCDIAGMVVS